MDGTSNDDSTKNKVKPNECSLKNQEVNRGAWTADEDAKLAEAIQTHGARRWKTMAAKAGLSRCGKSCRLRWMNYLRPNIKRGNISDQEEDLILRLHKLLGNRWSLIAGRLPGRTDNEIKNYWNSHLSKKSSSTEHGGSDSRDAAASTFLKRKRVITEKVNEEKGKKMRDQEEDASTCIKDGGGDSEHSKLGFNVDDFFDFSNENPFTLDWVSRFLQPR